MYDVKCVNPLSAKHDDGVFIAVSNHMQLTNTLTRCWADVGPSSLTVGQCEANDGLQRTSFQCWANIPEKNKYDFEPVHESRPIICRVSANPPSAALTEH